MNNYKDKFFSKHPILFAIFIIIIFIIAQTIPSLFTLWINIDLNSYFSDYLFNLYSEIIVILLMLIVGWKFSLIDETFFTKRNFLKGIKLTIPIMLFAIVLTLISIFATPSLKFKLNFNLLILTLFYALSVGFAEEIICRGLIFNNFIRKTGTTKKGLIFSMLATSIIFGLMHFGNVSMSSILDVTQQVIYAIIIGIVFNFIYITVGNLTVLCISHGLFDFFAFVIFSLYDIPYNPAVQSDILSTTITVAFMVIYFIILYKKYPLEESYFINEK